MISQASFKRWELSGQVVRRDGDEILVLSMEIYKPGLMFLGFVPAQRGDLEISDTSSTSEHYGYLAIADQVQDIKVVY